MTRIRISTLGFYIGVVLTLACNVSWGQGSDCNPPYPYEFCKDGQVCIKCSSSPNTLGNGHVPVKRAAIKPDCFEFVNLYPIFDPPIPNELVKVYRDFKPPINPEDHVVVFDPSKQNEEITAALKQWTDICGPIGDQSTACCPKIAWVHFKDDFDKWTSPVFTYS